MFRRIKKCAPDCQLHDHHRPDGYPITIGGHVIDFHGKAITKCAESVPDGGRMVSSHECGKKLKGDSEYPWLCGFHVSVIRRAQTREGQRLAAAAKRDAEIEQETKRLCELNEALGVKSVLQFVSSTTGVERFIRRPTGRAIIEIAELERLRDRINELEQEILRRRLGEQ